MPHKSKLPPPPAAKLQHGDLLWPKGQGAYIPYFWNGATEANPAEASAEQADWEAGQAEFRDAGRPETLTPAEFDYLTTLTFEEFRARYGMQAAGTGTGVSLLGGLVSVGHVAIVDVSDGEVFIVEALMDQGVIRRTYKNWSDEHTDDLIWWGRLKAPVAGRSDEFVAFAKTQIGKPYDFWNFDLGDERGFYCSKLVWCAVFNVFGIALDGHMDPHRGFWFSPRQLTHSRYVDMRQSTGAYGRAK